MINVKLVKDHERMCKIGQPYDNHGGGLTIRQIRPLDKLKVSG